MELQSLSSNDLKRCAEIFIEVFNSSPWEEGWEVASALPRMQEIAGTPGFVGIKAVNDGEVVGFVMGYAESFDAGSDFYLKEMCVVPELQRQGIGSLLLEELKLKLRQVGARTLYLLTPKENPAAWFYEKNGFETSKKMIVMAHFLNPEK
jgi:aminoglycoside 6'-N-acetyltransferase I